MLLGPLHSSIIKKSVNTGTLESIKTFEAIKTFETFFFINNTTGSRDGIASKQSSAVGHLKICLVIIFIDTLQWDGNDNLSCNKLEHFKL